MGNVPPEDSSEQINTHISERDIRVFLTQYEASIGRYLSQDSKHRIIRVLILLIKDGTYFPSNFTNFQIRGKWEAWLVFFTGKDNVLVKIPIVWRKEELTPKGIELEKEKPDPVMSVKEWWNHESFYYGLWSIYEFDPAKQFFRIPIYYKIKNHKELIDMGAIIMEEVQGRSLYFYWLIAYLEETQQANFQRLFPNGKSDYMRIKNDDELARMFGVTNIPETLTQFMESKNHTLDYESLTYELFGQEVYDSIIDFLKEFRSHGFEHWDIHPWNILIVKNPENDTMIKNVYLIDFWKSTILDEPKLRDRATTDIRAGKEFWKSRGWML